jgi:ABC-2 type transport system permease protein
MNIRRISALISKELKELLRDPITLGLCAAMPIVMLFLFGYAVNLDVEDVAFGVRDEDRTPASRELIDRFAATPYFALRHTFDSIGAAEAALQRSEVRLVLVIPPHFGRMLVKGFDAPVQILVDGTHSATAALASAYADAIVGAYPEPSPTLLEPQIRIWYNPSLRSVNYIVPGLFAVILMAFPPLLTALAIVREKETGTIQQIFASPVTSSEFVIGKLVPYGLVAFLEMLIVVAFAYFWFEIPFRGSLTLLLSVAFIYVLTTVGIGLLVSTVTRSQLAAMLLALIVTLMPSFLFSGFLFPVFTMPLALQFYSQLFPASYFMEVARGVVLKGAPLGSVWLPVVLLIGYTLIVFGFSSWRLKQKVA